MKFRKDKDILQFVAFGIFFLLLGCILGYFVPSLFFIWAGAIISGVVMIIMGIYVSSRPKAQLLSDERTNKNMYRAGYNAFWIILLVIAILNMFEFAMPATIKYLDASTVIMLAGVYSFLIFRWFYNKKGDKK